MKQTLSKQDVLFIGLMIFSLFFGAGNLIFPPELGMESGEHFGLAITGFLISGVGLPLLGLLSIAYVSDRGSSDDLGGKVHPVFGVALTIVTFLTVGPFFAAPRTGVVSYEIGIVPFLRDGGNTFTLAVFSIIYFVIVYILALEPGRFVDRIGKLITPFLLISIFILTIAGLMMPFNLPQPPTEEYLTYPLFKGITEGYLTMDAIVSIVFAMIVINSIRERGVQERRSIQKVILISGLIAVLCLSTVYVGLGYLGMTSSSLGFTSGANILAGAAEAYFGFYGQVILAIVILLACIPTATGLLSSCAMYFHHLIPALSYRLLLTIFVVFSGVIANVGLAQLIKLSIPVLNVIYPIIMVLILLSFADKLFRGAKLVYQLAVLLTAIFSINHGLMAINKDWDIIGRYITLPFHEAGFSWLLPAIIGALLGWILSFFDGKIRL